MARMPPPFRLSSWPWVVVRIDCVLCPRQGRYRLARLAVRYGPDMEMDRLLAHLAADCPWRRTRPRKYEARCGARLTDLDRATPPDLPAGLATVLGTDVLRRRLPPRESVPPRERSRPSVPLDMPMLSGWPAQTIVVTCRVCGRRDEHAVAPILARGDVRLTDLRGILTADCPQREAFGLRDRCNTVFVDPDPPPDPPALRVVAG